MTLRLARAAVAVTLTLGAWGVSQAWADITQGDPAYEKELLATIDSRLKDLKKAPSQSAKLSILNATKSFIDKETETARTALEKAEAGDSAEQKASADQRETEVLWLLVTFKPVFRELLSPRFMNETSFREKTCRELPRSIKLDTLSGKPDGAPLTPYAERAIAAVKELCK